MPQELIIIGVLVGGGIAILVVRYVISAVFNQAENAIKNQVRKNQETKTEDLADRFKK